MGAVSKYSKGWIWWLIVFGIAALVVTAAVLTIRKKSHRSREAAPVPGPPGAIAKKYAEALRIALQFFDIQKCTSISSPIFSIFGLILAALVFVTVALKDADRTAESPDPCAF